MSCPNCINDFCSHRCFDDVKNWNTSGTIQVSALGAVWRIKKGGLYRLQPYNNKGVLYVDLFKDGGQRRVAELVLKSFGIEGHGWIVYKDGDRMNCSLDNLEWKN